jgi:hypothetical protein
MPDPTPKKEMPRDIKSLARSYTDLSLKTLSGIAAEGASEGARVAAATALLDRGWGRPKQTIEHGGEDGNEIKITIRQIIEAKKTE